MNDDMDLSASDFAPLGFRLLIQIPDPMTYPQARAYMVRLFGLVKGDGAILTHGHFAHPNWPEGKPRYNPSVGWMVFVPGSQSGVDPCYKLNPTEKAVLKACSAHVPRGGAWIAHQVGRHRKTCYVALSSLLKAGFIRKSEDGSGYLLADDAENWTRFTLAKAEADPCLTVAG